MKEIKKYAIHILAVPAMKEEAFDLPHNQCAIIRLCDRSNGYPDSTDILQLSCNILDVEDATIPGSMTPAHARLILRFIGDLPAEVTDIYVCCSKGGSRSAGCAAALLLISGRSDMDVWKNPFYVPNTLVFYRICNEYGLDMSWENVQERARINEEAFAEAQEKGESKSERWTILF